MSDGKMTSGCMENCLLIGDRNRWKDAMFRLFKLGVATVAASLLTGCGDEDFTGAYRLQTPDDMTLVLNIRGDEADTFWETNEDNGVRIKPIVIIKATVKGENLYLDDEKNDHHWIMTRSVDGKGLDCLNCEALDFGGNDTVHWQYDPRGPYDLEQLVKEQARKDDAERNAAFEAMGKPE